MPATQTVEFRAVTGQVITAKLFTVGSDTEITSVTATEATNRKGTYTAEFTDVAAGEYQLLAFNATPIPVASWLVTLTLTTATFQVYDRVDKDGITRSNWAALTVDHTSTGSFGYVIGIFFSLIEFVTGWRFTAKAVELAGGNVTVTPLAATDIQRVVGTTITVFLKENITIGPIAVTDVNNDNVDLSAPCELIISQKYRGDVIVIADGSITRSGVDNHQFSFSSSGATLIPGTFAWSLRRVSDNYVFAHGDWIVKQTAVKD